MIYKDHIIVAEVPSYERYDVNEDGTIGEYGGDLGGPDFDNAEFTVYTIEIVDGAVWEDELIDGGFDTIAEAKQLIDRRVAKHKEPRA